MFTYSNDEQKLGYTPKQTVEQNLLFYFVFILISYIFYLFVITFFCMRIFVVLLSFLCNFFSVTNFYFVSFIGIFFVSTIVFLGQTFIPAFGRFLIINCLRLFLFVLCFLNYISFDGVVSFFFSPSYRAYVHRSLFEVLISRGTSVCLQPDVEHSAPGIGGLLLSLCDYIQKSHSSLFIISLS